jgi:polysaccharide chain length determinant protein (PEP-CTERM system associated)
MALEKESHTGGELRSIIDIAWRRKWLILIPFLIVGLVVTGYGLYLPSLYRSSTLIFLEPQDIPKDYIRATVTSDLEARLRTIKKQLTSRSKLMKVNEELQLFPQDIEGQISTEHILREMRNSLTIEVPELGESSFYFQVHYDHQDPTKAMLTVSRLVSLFIEDSLQIREQQAQGTTEFIENELAKLKTVLEEQEKAIEAYKRRYMGQLPGQLEANLRMLETQQAQLTDNLETQREVENRVILLEQEITKLEGQYLLPPDAEGHQEPITPILGQLIGQKEILMQRISRLESTYTPRHPDLIAAKRELENINEEIRNAQGMVASSEDGSAKLPPSSIIPSEVSRELTNLSRQLNESKPRLSSLRAEEKYLRDRIKIYQQRVEAAPKREQQLLSLSRDYRNTKTNYEELLNKKLEAQLSENLEKRQKGEKFRILDPANLPEKPFKPNRLKIIGMGIFGGFGLGIGLAFVLESLFPAFYNLRQLRNSVAYPIVIAIPHIASPREKRRNRIRQAIGSCLSIALILTALYCVDRYVLDLEGVLKTMVKNIRSSKL